jgi:hypothetical protein
MHGSPRDRGTCDIGPSTAPDGYLAISPITVS